jgi:hypothetical protein
VTLHGLVDWLHSQTWPPKLQLRLQHTLGPKQKEAGLPQAGGVPHTPPETCCPLGQAHSPTWHSLPLLHEPHDPPQPSSPQILPSQAETQGGATTAPGPLLLCRRLCFASTRANDPPSTSPLRRPNTKTAQSPDVDCDGAGRESTGHVS